MKVFIDVLNVVHFMKVFRDIFLVSYTLLFCRINVVLEFETCDKGFYKNFIFFQ